MKLHVIFLIIWALFGISESSDNGVCGYRPLVEDFRGSRVVGGRDAEPGNWPWVISIQEYRDDEYFHVCGGVVLNNSWVLTAAHCFWDVGNEYYSWRLVFGANQLSNMGGHAQIRTIKEKIEHENYDPDTESNDIALVRLNQTIIFDKFTQPACLPAKQAILSKLDDCYVAGWGVIKEQPTETSDILHEALVNIIPVDHCNRPTWYNGAVRDYNLCAGFEQGGNDSCQGYGGGPLMCKRSKAKFYTVVGITSWGSSCRQKQILGVFTSTQYYDEWINGHDFEKPQKMAVKKYFWQMAEFFYKVVKKVFQRS